MDRPGEIQVPGVMVSSCNSKGWKKNFQRARFFYRKASQLSPQDDSIFYKIGETYAREKQWEKAVKAYSVALHLDKENASYCMAIGNCLMEMDAENEALVCYLNAVKLKPALTPLVSFMCRTFVSVVTQPREFLTCSVTL